MLSEYPKVARLRDRIDWSLGDFILRHLVRSRERLDLLHVEARRDREILVFDLKSRERLRKRVVIPLRKFARSVVRDGVGRRLASSE